MLGWKQRASIFSIYTLTVSRFNVDFLHLTSVFRSAHNLSEKEMAGCLGNQAHPIVTGWRK